MEKKILFKTIHGSRLYGLNHEDSDEDFFTVLDKVKTGKARYAKQTITGDEDSMVVDFGTWVDSCVKGVPQSLEAMFSTLAIVDEIEDFRKSFRAGTGVYDTYLRTIKSFIMTDEYKKKRHGLRLAFNLNSIRECGRFNPTLSGIEIEIVNSLATLPAEYAYQDALKLAWS